MLATTQGIDARSGIAMSYPATGLMPRPATSVPPAVRAPASVMPSADMSFLAALEPAARRSGPIAMRRSSRRKRTRHIAISLSAAACVPSG